MSRPSERIERAGDPRFGWVVVGALGITETVSYGVLAYAFSVLLVPIEHDTGWSRSALTGAYSLAILVSGLAAISVGRLLDRRSPRLLMTAGSTLAALLVFVWSRAGSLLEFYAVFVGLGLAMALVLYEPAFIVVTKWFHVRRDAALTTLTLIAALASFIFSPLTERLVNAYGWRDAVAVLAVVLAVATIPLHALVLRPAPADDPSRGTPEAPPPTRRPVAGPSSFWLIVGALVLSSFAGIAVAVHLVSILLESGRGAAFAAFAAGLMGLAQIPGRVAFAGLRRHVSRTTAVAAVFLLGTLALLLLSASQDVWAVVVFVVCFGMSNGMATLVRATIVADLYGRARYGAISGVVSACVLAARAAAPFGAALIALAPGGYTTLLVALAGACALAAFAASRGVRSEARAAERLPPLLERGVLVIAPSRGRPD